MENMEMLKAKYMQEEEARLERNLKLAACGVKFIDIRQAYISEETTIGEGTVVYPGVVTEGKVTIGKNCIIGQNSQLVDSVIGDGVNVKSSSVVLESEVGDKTNVGPFAYIRPNCKVGKECRIGDFVELKNSNIGDGTKISHLTYVGDSDLGEKINLGCGVVFVNYDGKNKYRSTVKDGAFIGCNVNLVSPVTVGEKAYIGAGSTITKDVPAGALHVGRPQGKTIEGWVARRGLLDK